MRRTAEMQNAECRMKNAELNANHDKGLLQDRLFDFSVRVIAVVQAMGKSDVPGHIRMQMLRSGTSAGANYEEAVAAESRRDFVHKMQIVLKELRETRFWMRITRAAKFPSAKRLAKIIQESDELIAMTVKSVVTAKKGTKRGR